MNNSNIQKSQNSNNKKKEYRRGKSIFLFVIILNKNIAFELGYKLAFWRKIAERFLSRV